jgi:hypothetical protein
LKVPADGFQKVADCHRIADLEEALAVYGHRP